MDDTYSIPYEKNECIGLVRSLLESTNNISYKVTEILTLIRSNVNSNNLPAHILGIALRIEEELDDKDKVKQFGLALGLNSRTVEKIVNEASGKVFWEVLYEWNKTSKSIAILISACQRLSICPFSDGFMPPQHRTAIEKAYSRLANDIFVIHVVVYLRDNAVWTPSDIEYILSPETRLEQFRHLVDILPLFGKDAFCSFINALIKSGQKHLANMLQGELQ